MLFYLALIKPFKDNSMNFVLLINEILLLLFYVTVSINELGIVDVGSENIALLAIKVIIINLAVNIFSNIVKSTIQIVSFFRSKLCKKNEKVTPASDTTFTFELNKNTLS
jgi:hypothetical protein